MTEYGTIFVLAFTYALLFMCQSKYVINSYAQFVSSTLKTFGLHFIASVDPTKNNGQQKDIFLSLQQSITYYASLNCPLLSQIVVIVRNELQIANADFKNSEGLWQKKVFFLQSDGANYYILHPDSQSQLYFIMNSDAIISCDQLTKSFNQWLQKSIGDISPILTYSPASFNFISQSQSFIFDPLSSNPESLKIPQYFSIPLLNGAWVSRFYLQLFNTQKIQLIKNIRQFARKNNNCYDLAVAFVIAKYFPQLNAVVTGGQFQFGKMYYETENKYNTVRSECLKGMTLGLGFTPLRYVNKGDVHNSNRFDDQLLPFVVYMRRRELNKMMGDEQSGAGSGFVEPNAEQNVLREELSKLKQEIQSIRQKIITIKQQSQHQMTIKQTSPSLSEPSTKPNLTPNPNQPISPQNIQSTRQQLQSQKTTVKYILYGILSILAIMVIGVISYGCALCCECTESIEEQEEEDEEFKQMKQTKKRKKTIEKSVVGRNKGKVNKN